MHLLPVRVLPVPKVRDCLFLPMGSSYMYTGWAHLEYLDGLAFCFYTYLHFISAASRVAVTVKAL